MEKLPVQDRTAWYQDLSYMPTDYKKSRLWMAQSLFFAKMNSQVLETKEKALAYRRTDTLTLDRQKYINIIDPPTPKDRGGTAEFFSADFKAFPIDVHLDNILDAVIRTIPLRLNCSLADPIAKLQEQKDKSKIIAQRMVRNIINDFANELGLPKINESVDPYKWIQNFTAKKGESKVDEIGSAIDQIKNKIKDDDGLRLFQQYLYKNSLEVAFEIGIKYFLLDLNEFQTKYSDSFFRDLKHFNKFCGRWVIDEMTGYPMIKYIDPTHLYTSPFKDRNGDDILYFFYEENFSMADFERLVGSEMTYEEKKAALQLQKQQGWHTGTTLEVNSNKNNSQMRVGFFSILTQEANVFSKRYINDTTTTFDRKPLTWEPDANEEKEAKVYNVWQSCYYLPLNVYDANNNSTANWEFQANYIFKIQKDIDMLRHGIDKRYAKSSLVSWKNEKQASWTDIKESFMPKIHTLWHKFQNCVVQDVQGIALDYDLLGGMLNAVDEANKDGKGGGTAVVNEWKMLRQAGMAWLKFRNKNGDLTVDPSKLFVPIDSGHMKKGEMYLLAAMNLYNLLTQALAKGQATEGVQPAARTPLGGIEIAHEAASKATYFIEESYIEGVVVQFAYRAAHHIHCIANENKTLNYAKRWKQFTDVIGSYNAGEIESIADIKFENIGLTIANKDDSAKKELIIQNVVTKYAQKQLSASMLGLVLGTDNWKLQIVELSLEEQKQQEREEAKAVQDHQYQMELAQMQLQTAQALTAAKGQAKDQNILTEGRVQGMLDSQLNQLKAATMQQQKQQILDNKLTEDQAKAELAKDNKTHEFNLEQQKSLVA